MLFSHTNTIESSLNLTNSLKEKTLTNNPTHLFIKKIQVSAIIYNANMLLKPLEQNIHFFQIGLCFPILS